MQNYSIIGQGVPEIQGVTDTQTQDEDLLYRCMTITQKVSFYIKKRCMARELGCICSQSFIV